MTPRPLKLKGMLLQLYCFHVFTGLYGIERSSYIFLVHDVRVQIYQLKNLIMVDVCKLGQHDFSKGILYELSQYRKAYGISWDEFYGWILKLTQEVPKLETLKVALSR